MRDDNSPPCLDGPATGATRLSRPGLTLRKPPVAVAPRLVFVMADFDGMSLLRRVAGLRVPIGTAIALVVFTSVIVYVVPRFAATVPAVAPGQSLEVKDLIRKVKEELYAAEVEMHERKELPLFELKEFEMEVNFVVRTAGEVRAEVVGVGSNVELGTEKIQKLKLRWAPVPPQRHNVAPGTVTSKPDVVIDAPASDPKGGRR